MTLDEVIKDAERGFEIVAKNAKTSELYLSGHSAGCQMAAMMLNKNLASRLTGLCLLSGIYDLEPLVCTSINNALNLTPEDARRLSPMLVTPLLCQLPDHLRQHFRILIAFAENDSPAYQKQAIQYFQVSI